PKDFFFYNRTDSFFPVKHDNITLTSIVSPEHLQQNAENSFKDALALMWVNDNRIRIREIDAFVPGEHRIVFKDLGKGAIYDDKRDQFFAIKNSPHAIDTPGEFFLSGPAADGKRRLLLWPRNAERLDERISASHRMRGFDLGTQSYVEIDGFVVRKFSGTGMLEGTGICANADATKPSTGIVVRNNVVTHNASDENGYGGIHLAHTRKALVEGNHVAWNIGNRGIFLSDVEDAVVRKNRIEFSGGTGLPVYHGRRVQIIGNVITNIYATHANGLTLYIACENILVVGNLITEAQTPITFQDSGNLWFINNVTDGVGNNKNVNEWPNTSRGPWATGKIVFLNNTMARATVGASLSIGGDAKKEYIVMNNIIDGGAFNHKAPERIGRSHNIFTSLGTFQADRYGWKLGETELVVKDQTTLFKDPAALDYT
ncbi:MAG: right-handed parallel beta-helix repeat-containing protein, partial [Planctomycetota bacterium]